MIKNLENCLIGIDIGGTNIEAGLVNLKTYKLIEKKETPTFNQPLNTNKPPSDEEKSQRTKEAIINTGKVLYNLFKFYPNLKKEVGISAPGIISPEGEILVGVVFGNFHFKRAIEKHIKTKYNIKIKTHVENDINCAAYRHGEGLTIMIGTNLGSALNINGEIMERNTELKQDWRKYSALDEAGYRIRLDNKTSWEFFQNYQNCIQRRRFNSFFQKLSKENSESPGLVRLEQLIGGEAIKRVSALFYRDFSLDAKALYEIVEGNRESSLKPIAEKIWELESRLLGYIVAILQNEAKKKEYDVRKYYVGGKVAQAFDYMKLPAESSAKFYGADDFELIKSSDPNPNIIGAVIAYQRNEQ